MSECHTLIVSDIHLGSRICRTDKILAVLREVKFKTLIINGDLFDSDTTQRFNGAHWEVIFSIAAIAEQSEVFLVGGNHGRELDTMAKKMGLRVMDNYAFMVGGRKFLCLHGDEFDMFVKHLPKTTAVFTKLFYFVQRLGGEKQRVSMFIKRLSKKVLGISRRQQRLALRQGRTQQADVVICSHTHIPHVGREDGILFVNSGSFCNNPSTYVTIDKNGIVELKEI